jgi:acetyl-CoA carboxylase biotin carboxyl carrier protein
MSDKDKQKDYIDIENVKKLIQLMKENDLIELEVVTGHDKIQLKRPAPPQPTVTHVSMPVTHAPLAPQTPVGQPAAAESAEQPQAPDVVDITSPIVGTFYAAPSPDTEPYVEVGSRVTPDTVVCIIEAMKVMNEIKAETAGTIVEVLCQAGQAIEYGQVLFRVKTD